MIYILALIICIAFLITAIVKFKVHPFFVLLLAAVGYGLITGMDLSMIVKSIDDGFGGVLSSVGLIVILGIVMGTLLEKSGGALVIAGKVLKLIGEKSIHLAMMVSGYILSIPVFGDGTFVLMNPLNKVLTSKAGASYAGTTVALAIGLSASHVMVPPTPGPIAAAGMLGADLGSVITWGFTVSILALIPCYIFSKTIASKVELPIIIQPTEKIEKKPPFWKSLLAIVIPVLLIVARSFAEYPTHPFGTGKMFELIMFIGAPTIALLLGVFIALTLPSKWDNKIISNSGWLGQSITTAAPIILIIGAGGIFGKMIQNSGITDLISSEVSFTGMQLFFPFLLASCLKIAQGSSTVALITTAAIVAPLMPALGIDTPMMKTFAVLAIGAGSSVFTHVNDSFFWIMTEMTGMSVKQGYKLISLSTALFGTTGIIIIYLLSLIII